MLVVFNSEMIMTDAVLVCQRRPDISFVLF